MQAVILAAGRGTRMRELTDHVPKPMIMTAGKPLIEYKLDALPDHVDEVVIVVGYLGHVIQQHYGGEYKGKRILYVVQDKLDGTTGALWLTQSILNDRFIVLNSDDLYAKEDVARCTAIENGWAVLAQEVPEMEAAGKLETDSEGNVTKIVEGNWGKQSGLANTNLFVFDMRIFQAHLVHKAEGSTEIGLPQTAIAAAQEYNIPFRVITTNRWFQITTPEDVKKAEELVLKKGL